jgi:hypothetical protein
LDQETKYNEPRQQLKGVNASGLDKKTIAERKPGDLQNRLETLRRKEDRGKPYK